MSEEQTSPLLDRTRRELDRTAHRVINGVRYLRGVEFAPRQPTPRDRVWRQGKVELWRYRNDRVTQRTPVLIILGLVSRSSLFDLHETSSMVKALRDAGFDVYVLDWGIPDAADATNTLETYVSRYLPRGIRALLQASGSDGLSLIGYCMGGNLALLALAGHPELPIRNLVTMAAGVDWDQMYPQIDPLRRPTRTMDRFVNDSGLVPGELIAHFFRLRKPMGHALSHLSLAQNLWDKKYVSVHQAMARWTSDYVPIPGGVAQQVLDSWLRDNAFMTGRLRLDGRPIDLRSITVPTLAIYTSRDEIVPPAAARPIDTLLGSPDLTVLELDAGHVGLVVGRSAHKVMYPELFDWLRRH